MVFLIIKNNIKNFIIYDNDNFKLFDPTKKLLKINASYAFGTGYHSTTRHCIETMYECSKSKKFKNLKNSKKFKSYQKVKKIKKSYQNHKKSVLTF